MGGYLQYGACMGVRYDISTRCCGGFAEDIEVCWGEMSMVESCKWIMVAT